MPSRAARRSISLKSICAGEENAWGIPHFGDLPAIRWKRRNLESLRKSNPKKFTAQREALERLFEKGMVK